MDEVILHHYEASPFAAKVRVILGYKGIAWRSVQQPSMMPKPALLPLTGGYRKIPVMQIGADIYCDTALIARKLEGLQPTPSIYPDGQRGLAETVSHWADHWLFGHTAAPTLKGFIDKLPPAFLADRSAMGVRIDPDLDVSHSHGQLLAALDWLDIQLTHSSFVLGEAFSLADAAYFTSVNFLRRNKPLFEIVANRPTIVDWLQRVGALDSGARNELDPEEALAIAKRSSSRAEPFTDGRDPSGLQPGDTITIGADDVGRDKITGTAVIVTTQEIALKREDEQVGEVVVHFPRAGYRVERS